MLQEPGERLDGFARDVIGAALEVHRCLGPGFPQGVYERALALELAERGVPFERQVSLAVQYKGNCVGEWRVDLLVGVRSWSSSNQSSNSPQSTWPSSLLI